MHGRRRAVFEGRDGNLRPVPDGTAERLARLLSSPEARAFLADRGLDVAHQGDGLSLSSASLRHALQRAARDWSEAPPALDAPADGDGADGPDRLRELAAAIEDGSAERLRVWLAEAARPTLRLVRDEPDTRQRLLGLAHADPEAPEEVLEAVEAAAAEGLTLRTEVARRTLVPLLRDERTCGLAARVLGRAGVDEAVPALERALARTSSLDNRLALLEALIRLGHRALGYLTLRSMLTHGARDTQTRVVDLVEAIARPGDVGWIRGMLGRAPAVERVRLAGLLYRLGHRSAYAPLRDQIDALGPEAPRPLVEACLDAAERIGSARLLPPLRAYAERETRRWYAARARALLRRIEAEDDTPTPHELLEHAEREYVAGRGGEALRSIRDTLSLEPENVHALYLQANCLKDQGRTEEALRIVGSAMALAPSHWRLLRLRGSLLWDAGRHDAALASYDRALGHQPTDAHTWYYKGYVLYRLGRYGEALPCLDRALSLEGGATRIHNQKGLCLERLGRFEEAARTYRNALRFDPADPFTRERVGEALQAAGRLREALAAFETVLGIAPTREHAAHRRAHLLSRLERWEESAEAFSRCIELRSDSANAWYHRALCLRRLGRMEEARDCLRRTLRLQPDSTRAREHLDELLHG